MEKKQKKQVLWEACSPESWEKPGQTDHLGPPSWEAGDFRVLLWLPRRFWGPATSSLVSSDPRRWQHKGWGSQERHKNLNVGWRWCLWLEMHTRKAWYVPGYPPVTAMLGGCVSSITEGSCLNVGWLSIAPQSVCDGWVILCKEHQRELPG